MPELEIVDHLYSDRQDWPMMLTQNSAPGSGSLWGLLAVGLWVALLSVGLTGLLMVKGQASFRGALTLMLIGQLGLHLLYCSETFLYALHFGPLLILLAAFSTHTPQRPIALGLAVVLIITAGINNSILLNKAIAFFEQPPSAMGSSREQVLHQIEQRPDDPWPRGSGHVILALPRSEEVDKATRGQL